MDLITGLGIGIVTGLAPTAQKFVMQPLIRTLKRWTPNCWLKTALFFEIGNGNRGSAEGKPLKSCPQLRRDRRPDA